MTQTHTKMRQAVGQFQLFDDEMGAYAAQLGFREIHINTPKLPGKTVWDFADMKALKDHIESFGLHWSMVENVPLAFYDKVLLGLPGRDEQIENYCQTIRNLAKLDVRLFGHHFSPSFVWRTNTQALGRGNAFATQFNQAELNVDGNAFRDMLKRKGNTLDYDVFAVAEGLTAEKLFADYEYFIKAVLPVAEEEGVKLLLHPDDPPLRDFGPIQRMITSLDDYKRAMNIANSDAWGLNLCLGCCSSLGGADCVKEMIRYFGGLGKLGCVHFRDVQGSLPCFTECFLGDGNYDPAEILLLLEELGYDGLLLEDHVLKMEGDTIYGHRARANELGYIEGMIRMMEHLKYHSKPLGHG